MQSSLENLEGLERKLNIVISAEEVKQAYQQRLQKIAQNAKVDGFRPGKVPTQVLDKKYGTGVMQEVANDLVQKHLQTAIESEKLRIAGMPKVDFDELNKDKPLTFNATFEVYPEIEIKELEGDKVEKLHAEVTDDDVAKMLDKICQQHAEWVDVEREAKEGDRTVIDFEGFIGDEAFEGGKANGFQLELGSKQMIPGFEDSIIGNKAGDEFDIKVPFPDDYPAPNLAGKDAKFKIKLQTVSEPKGPELNDELAKKMGIAEGGVDALRAKVRSNMEVELGRIMQAKLKEAAFDKLIEHNKDVVAPKALIDAEIEHLQNMTRQQMAMQQGKKELPKIELPRKPYEAQAEKRVLLGLLLAELIQKYQLKADEARVKEKVAELAAAYQQPEEVIEWYYKNKQVLAEVEAAVLEDMAVEKLLASAVVDEQQKSYDDIVNQTQEE